ncbi:hypothetical protein [Jiangella endophytica]|uniref:hypothetical protein n=1 Tax=Jiangella endophytica TaxID=1623398 RepID=UPI0018E4EAC2|nr:hypothetical protein [Jiangella endophytica]
MIEQTSRMPSRRQVLRAGFAAGVLTLLPPSPVRASAAGGVVTISADGISVTGSPGGQIAVRDGGGTLRMHGSKFQTKDTVTGIQTSVGGTPSLVTLDDGTQALRMDYVMPAAAGAITVYGLFTVTTRRVHLQWHVSGSATLIPDGFLFSRAIDGPVEPDRFVPLSQWTRDAGGGVPYESSVGVAYASTWDTTHGLLILERSRTSWTSSTWVHAPGVVVDATSATTQAELILSDLRPTAAAAVGQGRELAVELWTDQPFGLWDGPGATMAVNVQVANGGPDDRTVDLVWWARDFDGAVLASRTVSVTVPAQRTRDHVFTLTAPAHGSVVTEVAAVGGGDEAFARTTLTVLPDFEYQAGEESMFGIANYPWLQVPSATALLDLWQRVGIKWVRIAYDGGPGLPPAEFDRRGILHNVELQPSLEATAEQARAWAVANTQIAIDAGARYFEVGNELNRPWNTGVTAEQYIEKALRPVHDEVRARAADLKLLNCGLAGMDRPWLERFHQAGGWDLIDGVAFHPGRGNFTADYVPGGDGGGWDPGATGAYWNYLGGLRQLKELIAQYGPKEIWMTEAYACTRPNAWWNDSYRHAAENVLLSLALAKAEGVRCVNWYQFHDSRLGSPQVADPSDVEYHFGLTNRDTSAKPSLLAYATAARHLDQARFVRWLDFPDGTTKGLLFDVPGAGQAAILWNRSDGYVLNTDGARTDWRYPAREVWVDTWPTKVELTFPTRADTVRQVDCIGQETILSPNRGSVTVTLDGAPRLFYGLDHDRRLRPSRPRR